MAEFPDLFVTPHAIEQFQRRISPLSEDETRRLILEGIRQATNVLALPDGSTWRVRTPKSFPFAFRAFCVFDEERGHFVVTTIVRGENNAARQRKQRARRREEK